MIRDTLSSLHTLQMRPPYCTQKVRGRDQMHEDGLCLWWAHAHVRLELRIGLNKQVVNGRRLGAGWSAGWHEALTEGHIKEL